MSDTFPIILFLLFAGALIVFGLGALTAHRGRVCHPEDGYDVPERVRSDPELRKRANQEVKWAAIACMVLCLPPMVYAGRLLMLEHYDPIPLWRIAIWAIWSVIMGAIAVLPFERMKHW